MKTNPYRVCFTFTPNLYSIEKQQQEIIYQISKYYDLCGKKLKERIE